MKFPKKMVMAKGGGGGGGLFFQKVSEENQKGEYLNFRGLV